MASFIKQNRKRENDTNEVNASIAYAAGMVASMSMAKKRPRFDQLFTFPKEEKETTTEEVEMSKARMILWAETVNRNARKEKKRGRRKDNS